MKSEINPNCCRICFTKCKKLRSLYKPVEVGDEPPNGMLQKVAGITVEEMEKFPMLPKNICKNCELSLSLAFEFREKALQSQLAIVAHMEELQITYPEDEQQDVKPIPHAYILNGQETEFIEDQRLDDNLLEENLRRLDGCGTLQSFAGKTESEYDDVIHGPDDYNEETLDDTETCMVDENNDSFNEEELQELHYEQLDNDEDDDREHDDVEHIDYEDEKHDEEDFQEFDAELQQEFISDKDKKPTWNLAEFQVDATRVKSRKVIRKPKNIKLPKPVSYICDICGNVYAKRGRMTEHRQRHDKQLKYACELCDEKFHMRELLRKHMYSHSGGKPLKCKYCSRTFYYESVRKAHEAVHQGIKPYVCNACGKSFSYSHSLKKHELIHANVKLYRCEYCNKDFRLQHHMKQHKMTRMHKKTVSMAENRFAENSVSPTELDNDDDQLAEDVLLEEGEILEDEFDDLRKINA